MISIAVVGQKSVRRMAVVLCAATLGTAAAAGAWGLGSATSSAGALAACDSACLSHLMTRYLDRAAKLRTAAVPLVTTALVRENTAIPQPADSLWHGAGRVTAREDFPDPSTGNIYTRFLLQRTVGQALPVSLRLKVHGREISEVETFGGGIADPGPLTPPPIPAGRQSSREDLIRVANGYFEALGLLDPGAVRLGPACRHFEAGQESPCSAGLANGAGQQAIERRFPVAIPALGVVVGYAFIMHHERVPPQDEYLEALFRIEDGRILEIHSRRLGVLAPGRSGFTADFPDPGIIRGAPPKPAAVVAPAPVSWHWHIPGSGHLRLLLEHGTLSEPKLPVLKPPYPGITDVRDIAYGPDPKQRLDILAPTDKSRPRTVLVFVHGGAWEGGTKHFSNDILYENVVLWAARHGMVAVNVDYRLADYHGLRNLYPTQEQDIAAVVDWIGAQIAPYGGDPGRIFLWGHSAGGSTIAGYASNPAFYGRTPGVKGIFLLSSPLDPTIEERNGQPIRYFGTTHQEFADRAPLRTLLKSNIPVLFGYSPAETDMAPELESARRRLCAAGRCPHLVLTQGSHDGEMRAVGTADGSATDALLAFMAGIP